MSTTAIINPPAVTREVRSLAEIEADIDRESGRLKHTKLRLGRLLLEAKEHVSHGDWADWVEARGIKMRSAQRYITLAKSDNLTHLPDDADATYPHRVEPTTATIAVFTPVGLSLGTATVDVSAPKQPWEHFCAFDDDGLIAVVFLLVGEGCPVEWRASAAEALRRMGQQVKRRKWDCSPKDGRKAWLREWASEEEDKLELRAILDQLLADAVSPDGVASEWRSIGSFIADHGEGGVNWWVGDWMNLVGEPEKEAA